MEKKEKVIFHQYDLRLKGRDYHVLIPRHPPKEAYVDPFENPPYLDGDYKMYRTIRGIMVALIRDPQLIAYLPSRQNGSINFDWLYGIFPTYDVVFSCHNAQLNRHQFEKLKDMLPYVKPRQRTVSYSIDGVLDYCEKEVERTQKNGKHYRDRGWKLYETSAAFFSVGSRYLFCESFGTLYRFITRQNYEAESRKCRSSDWTTALGFELGYVSMSIIRYWDRREKRGNMQQAR